MKKTLLTITALAFIVMTNTSCKKEYDCTCLITLNDGSQNEYSTNIRAKEKDKQAVCEAETPESDFGKTCTVN